MVFLSELDSKKFNEFVYDDKTKLIEIYTKTKMLLEQETFIEVITKGLICQSIELYKSNSLHIIEEQFNKLKYNVFEDNTDSNFLVFVITSISIMLNYTFEEAVLWLGRLNCYIEQIY